MNFLTLSWIKLFLNNLMLLLIWHKKDNQDYDIFLNLQRGVCFPEKCFPLPLSLKMIHYSRTVVHKSSIPFYLKAKYCCTGSRGCRSINILALLPSIMGNHCSISFQTSRKQDSIKKSNNRAINQLISVSIIQSDQVEANQ